MPVSMKDFGLDRLSVAVSSWEEVRTRLIGRSP